MVQKVLSRKTTVVYLCSLISIGYEVCIHPLLSRIIVSVMINLVICRMNKMGDPMLSCYRTTGFIGTNKFKTMKPTKYCCWKSMKTMG